MPIKNKDKITNTVLKYVFVPFKRSKTLTMILSVICLFLLLVIIYSVLISKITFSCEQLREICDFTISFLFAVSALGFTVFGIPLKVKEEQPNKNDIIFSYIGQIIFLAAVNIFAYIISYLNFLDSKTISLMSCVLLILLTKCITGLLSAIVAYFNIND